MVNNRGWLGVKGPELKLFKVLGNIIYQAGMPVTKVCPFLETRIYILLDKRVMKVL